MINKNKIIGWIFFLAITFSANAAVITVQDTVMAPKAVPVSNLVKDTSYLVQKKFKTNFKDAYEGSEFDYSYERQSKRSFIERLIQRIKDFFGYVDKKSPSAFSFLDSDFFKILSIIIIALLLAFIIRLWIQKDFNRFFKKGSKKMDVEVMDIEEQIHFVDFEKLLAHTLTNGNQRLAIRYYYLWLLKRLSNANRIEWHAEKTNADYLYEIKEPELKRNFEYVSYLYNNIWYGEFELSDEEFQQAQQAFITVLNTYKAYE